MNVELDAMHLNNGKKMPGIAPLIQYALHLADNALVLGHRNSEWTGHGPILEQDIAISNIALDLIGQSRNFYQYAAQLINDHHNVEVFKTQFNRAVTEDDLAYLRDAHDYRNLVLVEQTNGDWAKTILRQFLFSVFQYYLYQELINSSDSTLSAIAEKSLKETTYHVRWSSEWVIRLGDGTPESHKRMLKAMDELRMFIGELFQPAAYEIEGVENGFAVAVEQLKQPWEDRVKKVLEEGTLHYPYFQPNLSRGKSGVHSEHLRLMLAEMQFLQRAYPNSTW